MKRKMVRYLHQEGKCFYCLFEFGYHQMTEDHIFPQSKGGERHHNIVLTCGKCNSEKSSGTLYSFRWNSINRLKKATTSIDQQRLLNIIFKCTFIIDNPNKIANKRPYNRYTNISKKMLSLAIGNPSEIVKEREKKEIKVILEEREVNQLELIDKERWKYDHIKRSS